MRRDVAVIAAVAAGGAAGAAARYGLGVAWPDPVGSGFPWTTFAINVVGCLAIGALVAGLEPLTAPHHLLRPLLGTGFLGGFTTLSTSSDQARALIVAGRWYLAGAYLAGTVVSALIAVSLGTMAVRTRWRRP